jgi:hypothetical protein
MYLIEVPMKLVQFMQHTNILDTFLRKIVYDAKVSAKTLIEESIYFRQVLTAR